MDDLFESVGREEEASVELDDFTDIVLELKVRRTKAVKFVFHLVDSEHREPQIAIQRTILRKKRKMRRKKKNQQLILHFKCSQILQ